jgi:hypothetical protein
MIGTAYVSDPADQIGKNILLEFGLNYMPLLIEASSLSHPHTCVRIIADYLTLESSKRLTHSRHGRETPLNQPLYRIEVSTIPHRPTGQVPGPAPATSGEGAQMAVQLVRYGRVIW